MEELSRTEKIAMARRAAGNIHYNHKRIYTSDRNTVSASSQAVSEQGMDDGRGMFSTFVLRLFFSFFLFLTVLCVTRFDAMGPEKTEQYRTQVRANLRGQKLFNQIKKAAGID